MEMLHLRYFVAVAEHLGFSRAARQLHMATSPLSRRVRDLEHELGTTLFDRDSHSVRLTRAGAALLPIAKDVLDRFDDLPRRLRQQSGQERLVAYVGIPPGLHPRLREKLKVLQERAGGHVIKRRPGGTNYLVQSVQRGELALALAHLPVHAPGIRVREVLREPLGAVLPAAEFAFRDSVSLSELAEHSYVHPPAGMVPTYYKRVEARLSATGIKKRIQASIGDCGSTSEIVANGSAFAISMLDPGSGMQEHRREGVVVLPFSDFDPALATGLTWRSDRAEEGADLHELVNLALTVF